MFLALLVCCKWWKPLTRLLCMSWRFSMLNLVDTRPRCYDFNDLNDCVGVFAGWWFQSFFFLNHFTPICGEMIHCDLRIFFKWGPGKNHQIYSQIIGWWTKSIPKKWFVSPCPSIKNNGATGLGLPLVDGKEFCGPDDIFWLDAPGVGSLAPTARFRMEAAGLFEAPVYQRVWWQLMVRKNPVDNHRLDGAKTLLIMG